MSPQISPRTLLEAFLPFEGSVGLAVIYQTANHLDIEDQPIRLALRRLIASGDIQQHGRGRAGVIELSPKGRNRIAIDRIALQLAFAQDAGDAVWDGNWHLLAFSAPETKRPMRDAFRREMNALGAAPISTSLYVSPHDLGALLSPDVAPYLVIAIASTLTIRGLTDPRDIVEALWPAQETLRHYHALDSFLTTDPPKIDPLARQLLLSEALEAALRPDPLVPTELRRAPWPPSDIRTKWANEWNRAMAAESRSPIYAGWL